MRMQRVASRLPLLVRNRRPAVRHDGTLFAGRQMLNLPSGSATSKRCIPPAGRGAGRAQAFRDLLR